MYEYRSKLLELILSQIDNYQLWSLLNHMAYVLFILWIRPDLFFFYNCAPSKIIIIVLIFGTRALTRFELQTLYWSS